MEWESPIQVFARECATKIREEQEKLIYEKVVETGVHVDKEKLIELVAKDKPARIYPHTSANGMTRYVCPRCEMTVEKLDAKYCSECGQRFEEWI